MQIYTVGGAVRDRLLGFAPQDVDYVVVGATPDQMLACGYRQVGADFPVFLHPGTGAQYALARADRRAIPAASPRAGVVPPCPDVTLEDDLGRRDLTVNAMALDAQGQLIDPYGGQADLAARVLRHVSASSFREDPLRVLRIARLLARYPDFRVAPDTLALCQDMARTGELDALVAERVWAEISKGLLERVPSRMVEFLYSCGAVPPVLPELAGWAATLSRTGAPVVQSDAMRVLDLAARRAETLEVCLAVLCQATGLTPNQVHALSARLKLPQECRDLGALLCRDQDELAHAQELDELELVQLFQRVDAFRRPARLRALLQAHECCSHQADTPAWTSCASVRWLHSAFQAATSVNAGAIAQQCARSADIPTRVQTAREAAVRVWRAAQTLATPLCFQ